MAFHQPTHQWMQRVARQAVDGPEESSGQHQSQTREAQPDESQTWVLFSPATEASTTSYLSETDQSLETPGRSQLSDVGSLHTAAGSNSNAGIAHLTSSAGDEDDGGDDAELDSLDSHLPEFRSSSGAHAVLQPDRHQSLTVFPNHDGLGLFRLDQPVLGQEAQDHIYQFEQFNPRRVRRRTESLDHVPISVSLEQTQEVEKRQRIEAWRLEQSRILLDEVQRETRRRRKSQASLLRAHESTTNASSLSQAKDSESDNMTWHDEEAIDSSGNREGFVARFTRSLIRDLLGLDEKMLSVLLGESLPDDEGELSATPRASQINHHDAVEPSSPWQLHILERVSRELGLLVNHISHHPGAFTTYTRMQQLPIPYAGLPVIPESGTASQNEAVASAQEESEPSSPEFRPTVQPASQPITIPGRHVEHATEVEDDVAMGGNTFTKEEWEQDLDIRLVFRYLRSRFLSGSSGPSAPSSSRTVTGNAQDVAARAARVRQHHPLISRSRPIERRSFKAATPSSPVAMRHHSSCASQSTRRSARRRSCSSRHYWDLGGSLGTGSMIASNGPMGSWGEV